VKKEREGGMGDSKREVKKKGERKKW